MKMKQATCGYCAVGCNFQASIDENGKIVRILGEKSYPTNQGLLCPKGMNIEAPALAEDRAKTAFIRSRDTGKITETAMDTAVAEFVRRVKATQEKYGKDACAYYSTGQLTMEEFALLGLVGRAGMGMEGDGNTRLCMTSAVVAYKKSFGFDAPPFTYEDWDESDCLVFIGANPAINQPVLWMRHKRVAKNKDHDLIVLDPRKTETAAMATLHIPMKPKTDLIILYTLANTLIQRGWIDKEYVAAHVEHFDEFAAHVAAYRLQDFEKKAGISPSYIEDMAKIIHERKKVSFWWTMGVNQSHEGTMVGCAIIALSLITGNIGRAGTGANSITGQCNAMGSRINSLTTSLYGGRDFTNPQHRAEVAKILNIDESRIPSRPTIAIDQIVSKIHAGEIKFLWIIATNPIQSFVSINGFKEAVNKLDTLVVQDLYHDTPTAQYADIFLPGKPSVEKHGTFINMERRLGAMQPILDAAPGSETDYNIFLRIAKEYACDDLLTGWESPANAFQTLRKLSAGRPCDFTGVKDYNFLLENGGIQWPFPEGSEAVKYKRLFGDGVFYTPSGKAQLVFEDTRPPKYHASVEYPFTVLSGRATMSQFHTGTRTNRVKKTEKLYRHNCYVNMNPQDMEELRVSEGSNVLLTSPVGAVQAEVYADTGLQAKQVFLPMHYKDSNLLISSEVDVYSRQPSFKHAVARIESVQENS